MDLTLDQKDLMKEVFNLGVGSGAAALSELSSEVGEVILNVPDVDIIKVDLLADLLKSEKDPVFCFVHQEYRGLVCGSSFLVFDENHSKELIALMMGSEYSEEQFFGLEADALCEVGNIILNSCLKAIGNYLGKSVFSNLPKFSRGTVKEIIRAHFKDVQGEILYLHMRMKLADFNISGHIGLVFEGESLSEVVRSVESAYEGIVSGKAAS